SRPSNASAQTIERSNPATGYGAPLSPTRSAVAVARRRFAISACAFQSESSCTRPCCIQSALSRLLASSSRREKSPVIRLRIENPPSGREDDLGLESPGQELGGDRRDESHLFRLAEAVEGADLAVGPVAELRRAERAELRVAGLAVDPRGERRDH